MKYALRHRGSNDFAAAIPIDPPGKDFQFVYGWDNPDKLEFDTEEQAQTAIDSDPDGYMLIIEEIDG